MSEYYKDPHKYDDIITMPYKKSERITNMSLHDRAAQFGAFEALTGHEEAIEETARLTESKITLDETMKDKINEMLYEISKHLDEKWSLSITYFKPDSIQQGGAYLTDIGTVKKMDELEKYVIMDSCMKIPMEQIIRIDKA